MRADAASPKTSRRTIDGAIPTAESLSLSLSLSLSCALSRCVRREFREKKRGRWQGKKKKHAVSCPSLGGRVSASRSLFSHLSSSSRTLHLCPPLLLPPQCEAE
eukprot:scaffold72546_cov28-Tisochrysis_lutea.AAC.1